MTFVTSELELLLCGFIFSPHLLQPTENEKLNFESLILLHEMVSQVTSNRYSKLFLFFKLQVQLIFTIKQILFIQFIYLQNV